MLVFVLLVLYDLVMIVCSDELCGVFYLLNVWGSWCVVCCEEYLVLICFVESKCVCVIGYNWKDDLIDVLYWLE